MVEKFASYAILRSQERGN